MVNNVANAAKPKPTAAPNTAGQPKKPAPKKAGGDYDTFLKMLTTQIKNQDPLNPMQNSEFAVQLATFSGVEQQAQTNKLLEKMIGGQGQSSMGALSGWIGKEARVTGPVFYGGKPVTLNIAPDRGSDNAVLIVEDKYGREVSRRSIGPGNGEIDWAGVDSQGNSLPSGLYSFKLESMKAGKVLSKTDVGAFARVLQTEVTSDGITLGLEGGAVAKLGSVTAIRAAGS